MYNKHMNQRMKTIIYCTPDSGKTDFSSPIAKSVFFQATSFKQNFTYNQYFNRLLKLLSNLIL